MLEEYMKHLQPDSVDFDDTTQALAIVSSAADHANTTVKKGVTELFIFVFNVVLITGLCFAQQYLEKLMRIIRALC